jgi:hypothetical protein
MVPTARSVSAAEQAEDAVRMAAVRAEFLHAWSGYEQYAWGHDELRPVTNGSSDTWGGFGATLIDGLDTLMLIDGIDSPRVARAREFVATRLSFDRDVEVSFFEFTIRYVGGLLGAYELSSDAIYLTRAVQLADRLVLAFNASQSGLPLSSINLRTGVSQTPTWNMKPYVSLSEVGSCQVELAYLSYHTGNPSYAAKARLGGEHLCCLECLCTVYICMYVCMYACMCEWLVCVCLRARRMFSHDQTQNIFPLSLFFLPPLPPPLLSRSLSCCHQACVRTIASNGFDPAVPSTRIVAHSH